MTGAWVVFAVALGISVLLLLWLCGRLLAWLRQALRNQGGAPTLVAGLLRRWRLVLRGARRDEDEFEERVTEILWEKRIRLARDLVPIFALILVPVALRIASALLLDHDGSRNRSIQVAACVSMCGVFAVFTVVPRLLCRRTLPAMHVCLMLFGHIWVSPLLADSIQTVEFQAGISFAINVGLSFLCLDVTALLATNVFECLLWLASLFACEHHAWFSRIVTFEVVCLFLRVGLSGYTATLLRQLVRHEVETKAGACQRSAVSSLLGMMCDAVVDLDDGLAMKEHVQQIAGLLMHGSGKSLQGSRLTDFFCQDDDKRRFEQISASSSEGGGLSPSMLNVSFRDSLGNSIKAVTYHVPYRSITGRVNHLIGLREDTAASAGGIGDLSSDDPPPERGFETDSSEGASFDAAPVPLGRVEMPAAVLTEAMQLRLYSRGRRPRRRNGSGGSSQGSGASAEERCVDVWAKEGLPITRSSGAFRRAAGVAETKGRSLLEFVPGCMGEGLTRYVVENSRRVSSGEREAFIGTFGEAPLGTGDATTYWTVEVCFPKPHPDLVRRNQYLAGVRFVRQAGMGRGTSARSVAPQALTSARAQLPGLDLTSL